MIRLIKAIFLVIVAFSSVPSFGQLNTLTYPDTVCINQDVFLTTSNDSAASYFWGTCSAWLERQPKGSVIASNSPLDGPTTITLKKENGNYHLFTINYNAPYDLVRMDFGASLLNLPTPVNLGNFSGSVPSKTTGFDLVQENGNWIGYAIGGIGIATQLTRFNFGTSLSNVPVVTNLGNLSGLLISPQDIHLFNQNGNWYAYYLNGLSGNLIRLDFGATLLSSPTINDLGNLAGLSFPTGLKFVKQSGSFYAFAVNRLSSSLTRLDFGTNMLNTPQVFPLGNFGGLFNQPRYISIAKDDEKFYGYVSNEGDNTIALLKFGSNISNVPTASNMTNFGSFNGPRGISEFIRDQDNVFGFVSNFQTSTISMIHYDTTTNATILKNYDSKIPVYQYTKPGLYNVYVKTTDSFGKVNEEQHRIQVLALPKIDFHNDTLICQGDTIFLVANGARLSKILWSPTYNLIYQNDTTSVYVFPEEDYTYNINMQYEYGCIVDTHITVKVSKIKADAGPDRLVMDGGETMLGGPALSEGYQFQYEWLPNQWLNNLNTVAYPISKPLDSLVFYYLKVQNTDGCIKYDTVAVKTFCGEVNCPNAFNPTSTEVDNRTFGIMNYQLNKLDFFRVFNRFGEMVFETTNPSLKWDGNFKGVPQPLGTYIWMAEGICNNGRKVKRNGNVLLVR